MRRCGNSPPAVPSRYWPRRAIRPEGGENDLSATERIVRYRALLPHVALIDTELRSFPEMQEVMGEARDRGVIVVGSFHDFEKTPPLEDLLALDRRTPDIFKVATLVHSPEDLIVLEVLLKETCPASVMGMGDLGAPARPHLARLGSLFNYGFLGNSPTAPGQWSAAELKRVIQS